MSKQAVLIKKNDVKRAMERALFSYARDLRDAKKNYFKEDRFYIDDSEFFEYGLIRGLEMLAIELDIKLNTSKINY